MNVNHKEDTLAFFSLKSAHSCKFSALNLYGMCMCTYKNYAHSFNGTAWVSKIQNIHKCFPHWRCIVSLGQSIHINHRRWGNVNWLKKWGIMHCVLPALLKPSFQWIKWIWQVRPRFQNPVVETVTEETNQPYKSPESAVQSPRAHWTHRDGHRVHSSWEFPFSLPHASHVTQLFP